MKAQNISRVNTGIASGRTGMYPAICNVEQGIRGGMVKVNRKHSGQRCL